MNTCQAKNCGRTLHSTTLGYCNPHYKRFIRCGSIEEDKPIVERHGMTNSPEYKTWHHMKLRCLNPKMTGYENYGGRGIKVCDRWKDFRNFYKDMGTKPTAEHSIDRIDVNGDYELSNCRWATPLQQQYNKRTPKNNTSGVTGVSPSRNSWKVRYNGKAEYYQNFDKAVARRKEELIRIERLSFIMEPKYYSLAD